MYIQVLVWTYSRMLSQRIRSKVKTRLRYYFFCWKSKYPCSQVSRDYCISGQNPNFRSILPVKNIFRVILASVSSYFRVLFQCRTWIDSDNFVIYVDDAICSENILRQLVDFAYTQNIQIRPGNDNTFGHKMVIFKGPPGPGCSTVLSQIGGHFHLRGRSFDKKWTARFVQTSCPVSTTRPGENFGVR